MTDENIIGKILVAKTLTGAVQGVGLCVAYTEEPTVVIKDRYGLRFSWLASLCRVVELSEEEAKCFFQVDTQGPR